jgi:hypothetical protein
MKESAGKKCENTHLSDVTAPFADDVLVKLFEDSNLGLVVALQLKNTHKHTINPTCSNRNTSLL